MRRRPEVFVSHRRSLALVVALLCAPGAARAVADGEGSLGQPGPEVAADPCATDLADPTCDSDSDGLTNAEELVYETNPADADTDDDGLLDGDEIIGDSHPLQRCSPFLDSPSCDRDGDGLANADEDAAGTSRTNPDSDDDGVLDGADKTALDPCEPSTDSPACDEDLDGLTNAAEDALGTARTLADSDGDDLLDGVDADALDACVPSASAAACTPASDAAPDTEIASDAEARQAAPVEEAAPADEAALEEGAPDACANGADASGCDLDGDGVTGAIELRLVSDVHGNVWLRPVPLVAEEAGASVGDNDASGERDEDGQVIDVSGGGLSCAQSSAQGNAGLLAMLGLVGLVRTRRSRAA